MSTLRLAELREGTWLRPANLTRPRPGPVVRQCTFLVGRPEEDPATLAAALWDLDAWTAKAGALRTALAGATTIAERFTHAAAVLRHLLNDPLLPPPSCRRAGPDPNSARSTRRSKRTSSSSSPPTSSHNARPVRSRACVRRSR
ncbi:hypothetical protein LUX39_32615 [Actinomadura madurae]|nr:hypothetical protein [Actinomadura madurae]MCP9969262.1 hypothetical protein [Actinomadura madurae]MCQ0006746.1 hypothetical protein [Actinomadura madurae]MCQ0017946.1 hypothetical protein [Actinomadura madurae]